MRPTWAERARAGRQVSAACLLAPLAATFVLTGCSTDSAARDAADTMADRAMVVMQRPPIESARTVAERVTGEGADGTIELVSASGDNRTGVLVLEVVAHAVATGGIEPTTVSVTRCYEYDWTRLWTTDPGVHPAEVDCP